MKSGKKKTGIVLLQLEKLLMGILMFLLIKIRLSSWNFVLWSLMYPVERHEILEKFEKNSNHAECCGLYEWIQYIIEKSFFPSSELFSLRNFKLSCLFSPSFLKFEASSVNFWIRGCNWTGQKGGLIHSGLRKEGLIHSALWKEGLIHSALWKEGLVAESIETYERKDW